MAKIISVGKCSNSLVYPLMVIVLVPLIANLRRLIQTPLQNQFFFIQAIGLMFLAEIIGGCLFFFDNYKSKKRKIKKVNHITVPKMAFIQFTQKRYTWKVIIFILGLGALDLIAAVSFEFISVFDNNLSNVTQVFMALHSFVYIILSILILHQQIYKHHYVSIAILIFGTILIIIPVFSQKSDILIFILCFLCSSLYVGLYICDKWLIQFKGVNPYFLLLFQGISGLTLFGVMEIFLFTLCPNTDKWYCNDLAFTSQLDANGIYFMLLQVIESMIFNICLVKIIQHFSPLYYHMVSIIASIVIWIIHLIRTGDQIDYFSLCGYFVLIVAFLIFNEMVIIHLWRLDFNTTKMIEERSRESYLQEEVGADLQMREIEQENDTVKATNCKFE